ncbi:MAG: hypothetical protein ABJN42_09975 [Roseibium sp.]|uniref:hypothetical protein n=1 Tax=Roseibium sp. TaxID=1936156 RepID=UPI00329784E4
MMQIQTADDIREELKKIFQSDEVRDGVRGCHGTLQVYARLVQKRIVEPMLSERGADVTFDDLGHDTPFKSCWNKAVRGESEDWDCRWLAEVFVNSSIENTDDIWNRMKNEGIEEINNDILNNLPDILLGQSDKPLTGAGLRSWVTSELVFIKMNGDRPETCNEFGEPGQPPQLLLGGMIDDIDLKNTEIFGLMSFHGEGIDHDEGQKAWSAWRREMGAQGLDKRGRFDSLYGLAIHTMGSTTKVGVTSMMLRQDENVSVEITEEGVRVYRGQVNGLKNIVDEGEFICGRRQSLSRILVDGGFTAEEAEDYLDRLAATSSAFTAKIPDHSSIMYAIDPETLYAFDMGDDDMVYDIEKEEALPIYLAGNFPMVQMTTHRERQAQSTSENASEGPEI